MSFLDKPSNRYHYNYLIGLTFTILIGSLQFGYALSCFNPIIDILETIHHWAELNLIESNNISAKIFSYAGLITALIPLGATISSFFAGFLARNGRRYGIFIANIFFIIGAALTMYKPVASLLAGRFLVGFGVGIVASLCPMMIKEYTPLNISGIFGSFHQCVITIGILIPMLIALWKPSSDKYETTQFWRIMFGMPIVFSLIQIFLLFFFFTLDTPKFLISIDQSLGRKILEKIYVDTVEINDKLLENERIIKEEKNSGGISICRLFGKAFRYAFFVGIFVAIFQQFTGINVMIMYSTTIFSEGGHNPDLPNIILNVCNSGFTIVAALVIESLGRKPLLILGSLICAVTISIVGFLRTESSVQLLGEIDTKYYLMVFIICLFISAFELSLGPITWVYLAEILPPAGISICVSLNMVFTCLVGFFTPVMLNAMKSYTFFLYGALTIIYFFFSIFGLYETRGLTEEQIRRQFSGLPKELETPLTDQL